MQSRTLTQHSMFHVKHHHRFEIRLSDGAHRYVFTKQWQPRLSVSLPSLLVKWGPGLDDAIIISTFPANK